MVFISNNIFVVHNLSEKLDFKQMRIASFSEKCVGCRTCEVACAFHHRRTFGRKSSSLSVRRFEREGRFEIVIYEKREGERPACDLCGGEPMPLCVKLCPVGALEAVG